MSDPGHSYSGLVQSAMERELLRSERRRVLVLIGLLGFLLGILVVVRSVPGLISEGLRPRVLSAFAPMSIVIGVYLAYEIGVLVWLRGLLRAQRSAPASFRYLNALVEISLPTVAMLAGALVMGGLPMLAGAAPFAYFPFLCLAALNLDFRLCVFAGAVAGAEFVLVSLVLLRLEAVPLGTESPVLIMLRSPHQWLVKGLFLLASGFIAGFVARQIRHQLTSALQTMEERDRAVSIFGQHVSPQVADLLLKQPMDYAGRERNVCVMFFDIRDFSRLAAERSPAEVMDYLNTLFGSLIPAVNAHHGIINKFLGDVVNLASRIEQATKQFNASLLVSEAVAKALDGPAGTDLGLVELKGQTSPVRLFKLA